jgi:hypothetical protein
MIKVIVAKRNFVSIPEHVNMKFMKFNLSIRNVP